MVRNSENNEIDSLFKLPLSEFIGARNALAARLKQSGRGNDASIVKALAKPSVSAWAVNQLYWNHRPAFERLITAGQRVQKIQVSGLSGKVADMRASMDARRESLLELSDLAASLLNEAGHNSTPDMIRRVITTLEALSSYNSLPDGPTPGRLTQDVDPPGFDSLVSAMTGVPTTKARKDQTPVEKSVTKPRQAEPTARDVQKARQLEETRRVRIAAAKVSLQEAKKSASEARVRAQYLEAAQKKAQAEAKEADKQRREAEERLKKMTAASKEAAERARSITDEARDAAKGIEEANRAVAKASKELESLFADR
jgi:hypothetical protein